MQSEYFHKIIKQNSCYMVYRSSSRTIKRSQNTQIFLTLSNRLWNTNETFSWYWLFVYKVTQKHFTRRILWFWFSTYTHRWFIAEETLRTAQFFLIYMILTLDTSRNEKKMTTRPDPISYIVICRVPISQICENVVVLESIDMIHCDDLKLV